MDKLRTRLKAAVATDFQGSAPKASKAAGLNPNAIDDILQNPKREPKISTLDALAGLFGWSLCEVAYWVLDREPPVAGDYDPIAELHRAWRHLGVPEPTQAAWLTIMEPAMRPAPAPPRNAHSQ